MLDQLSFIARHPLNRTRKAAALLRFLRWQIGSRLVPGAVAVPFVDSTRLLVRRGMTGATGNVYCGLHEFEDMAFVLHALHRDDRFADIGANVGSYTILAAGGAGAACVSVEPDPATFAHLLDNIRLNNLVSTVTAKNIGVSAAAGTLRFTSGLDTVNHVVADREAVSHAVDVPVERLDTILSRSAVTLMKIDVEGFETEVLNGAGETMAQASLLAVVMELNGSGIRYGYDDEDIHRRMVGWGFTAARYDPLTRTITPLRTRNAAAGNTLYVRDLEELCARVRTAPSHTVLGSPL